MGIERHQSEHVIYGIERIGMFDEKSVAAQLRLEKVGETNLIFH